PSTACSRAVVVWLSMTLLRAERALGLDLEWVLPRHEEGGDDNHDGGKLETDREARRAVEHQPECDQDYGEGNEGRDGRAASYGRRDARRERWPQVVWIAP